LLFSPSQDTKGEMLDELQVMAQYKILRIFNKGMDHDNIYAQHLK
jgi:hypothetical protein